MSIDKITSKIANSSVYKTISSGVNKVSRTIGSKLENSPDTFNKVWNKFEPTGANNSFLGLCTLMAFTVIIPRVLTAAKRNPDNQEATKDEIKEILFRDAQTVLVILFALKALNSTVAGFTTKLNGLPMTNKPYQNVFNTKKKGLEGIQKKANEFLTSPVEKLKIIGKNILDTLHPTDGVRALTNDEFVAKYTNYNSIDNVKKMLNAVEKERGDKSKVFDKIITSLINEQNQTIAEIERISSSSLGADGKMLADSQKQLINAKKILEALEKMKEKGASSIDTIENKAIEDKILSFFRNKDNSLVHDAKGLNAKLRTFALAIEAGYLGWGLPALNQIRLENKYLKNQNSIKDDNVDYASAALIGKNIKANEVKLYHGFIK